MSFEEWATNEIRVAKTDAAVKQPTPHSSMYKYISLDGKMSWNYLDAMLNENKLYGATLKSLNDPFEGAPYIIDDLSSTLAFNSFDYVMKKQLGQKLPNFEDLETYRNKTKKYLINLLKDYRVISFCNRSDSPLLWSHYANSYKGACLHFLGRSFEVRAMPSAMPSANLGYVTYSNHRPHLPLSLALKMLQKHTNRNPYFRLHRAELEKYCFFSKGLDWQYENEVRAIYNAKETTSIKFRTDGLVSIILGPRMKNSDKEKLMEKVKQSPFSNIPIVHAKLAKNTFSVNSLYEEKKS